MKKKLTEKKNMLDEILPPLVNPWSRFFFLEQFA